MPLHLEVTLVCQVCDDVLFAESVDHGPKKNGAGWVAWMLTRAAVHQNSECKGPKRCERHAQRNCPLCKTGNA